LITEIAGGEISSNVVDIYPKKIEDHQVFLHFDNATKLIGQEIPRETIKEILTSLDIKINNVTESGLGMTIPAYRNDVTREADVIEEVLRVYGYNNIDFTQKLNASIASNKPVEDYQIQNKVSNQLISQGYHEMLGNSLTSPKYTTLLEELKEDYDVKMLNPLSQELSVMRQSMLFGALEALSYNNNRRIQNVKLFEFGKTYHSFPSGREEKKHLTLLSSGDKTSNTWVHGVSKSDFFYFKGMLTAILARLGITEYTEKGTDTSLFSEGLTFVKNKKKLVSFGVVSKKVTKHFDIETETLYADFDWDVILNEITSKNFILQPIPKFPEVKRDFALLLDEAVTFEGLKAAAFQTEQKLLKDVNLFDVYTGKNLPEGKKSYALSFTLQDESKTLTDKQIDKIMNKLQQRFATDFEATLR